MPRVAAPPWLRRLGPWLPYPAILVGLYVLHSAWWALGLYHAGMLAVLAQPFARGAIGQLGRGRGSRWAFPLVAGGAALGPLLWASWSLVAADAPAVHDTLRGLGLSGAAWVAFAVYYALVHPGIEEAYWRGVVAPTSARPWTSDLAFAGYHALVLVRYIAWPWALVAVAGLTGTAALWRHVARTSGGLFVPWLSHVAADASFIAALALLARAPRP